MVDDETIGLLLALSSSFFIGASFIIKKKGLRLAGASGLRAGAGGYAYLREPLWWMGMLTMAGGEAANFAAYAFAPAILVTPLGALSIIISAILAHHLLSEKLHLFGWLGCMLCIVGSTVIVLHAPHGEDVLSVQELWGLATQPPFLWYAVLALTTVLFLVFHVAPKHGTSSLLVPIAICSIMGSLSVMSCKAVGSALRLTFAGENQFAFPETWYCLGCVAGSVVTQMNFLNRALDIFPAALVTPIYYVMFTTLTILASVVLFKEYESVAPAELATELCGFLTILAGVFVLHATKDADPAALWKRREGDAAGGVQMAGGVAQSPGAAAGGGRGVGGAVGGAGRVSSRLPASAADPDGGLPI